MSPIPRIFTLEEANAALPAVRDHIRAIRKAVSDMEARAPRREQKAWLVANPGGVPVPASFFLALLEFQEAASALHEMGCLLKDVKMGLVDFPSQIDGRDILLCWRDGEESVGYWHDLESGYSGRRPLGKE